MPSQTCHASTDGRVQQPHIRTSVKKKTVEKHALVIGGGGVTGAAWELGLIAGLAAQGINLAADLIVGTSACAFSGAQLLSGLDLELLYQL